jgi:hypothetical protein
MKLFPWLSNIPALFNPATGLPMVEGTRTIDVQCNPYCVDMHTHDHHNDSFDQTSSTLSDPFDLGSASSSFDSFGGGFGGGGIGDL